MCREMAVICPEIILFSNISCTVIENMYTYYTNRCTYLVIKLSPNN